MFYAVDKIWAGDLYGCLQWWADRRAIVNAHRSDANILSYLWNEYIKLNAKYCYAIRLLDMHAKMPYTSDANIFTYFRKEREFILPK